MVAVIYCFGNEFWLCKHPPFFHIFDCAAVLMSDVDNCLKHCPVYQPDTELHTMPGESLFISMRFHRTWPLLSLLS